MFLEHLLCFRNQCYTVSKMDLLPVVTNERDTTKQALARNDAKCYISAKCHVLWELVLGALNPVQGVLSRAVLPKVVAMDHIWLFSAWNAANPNWDALVSVKYLELQRLSVEKRTWKISLINCYKPLSSELLSYPKIDNLNEGSRDKGMNTIFDVSAQNKISGWMSELLLT